MEFNFRSMDADAHSPANQMYRTQSSSTYTYFSEQALRAGFPRGNFGRPEMYRGASDVREAIQREIEKERIREEILAEEMARKRVLEAEVRRELMMEREMMAMRSGEGFSSSFMQPPENHMCERRMLQRQPISLEERIGRSLEERYGVGGRRPEIGGFEMVPFQRLGDSPKIKETATPVPEAAKQKVIVMGMPNNGTLSGSKRKPTPSVASGSNELGSDGPRKKPKEEWSCAICQVSATSERGLTEHLQGKKHQAKEASLKAQRTGANLGFAVTPKRPSTRPVKISPISLEKKLTIEKKSVKPKPSNSKKKEKFKFWCEICEVGAYTEKVMNHHRKGRRHLASLLELSEKGEIKAETKKPVVDEVKSVTIDQDNATTEKSDAVGTEVKVIDKADTRIEENSEEAAEVKTVEDGDGENIDGRDNESI